MSKKGKIDNNDYLIKKFMEYEETKSIKVRNELIEINVPLVQYVVCKYLNDIDVDRKELISLGYFGLINAVETFDYQYGISFSSYATKCILNYIKKNLRTVTNVKISHYNYPVLKMMQYIEKYNGISLINSASDIDEILEENDFIDKKIRVFIKNYVLNHDINYCEDNIQKDYEIESSSINKILCEQLTEELEKLPEKEREILKLRYGFYGSCFTADDIGNHMNCTHQNILQLQNKALKKLREKLQDK